MKKRLMYFCSILFFSVILNISAQPNLKEITFATHWLPQAQFAGYYVGVQKDIYKKYGLDVKIIHATINTTSQDLLLEGKVDFASMWLSTAMFLKSYNYPVVNVCQLSQKCAQMLVTKNKKLNNPSDINGMKIGVWRSGFDEILSAFVNKYNLEVEIVPINSTINLFLFGGIDLLATMWYNEYHSILNSGINEDELNTFFFADYGFNIPEEGIYCLNDKIDQNTINQFVTATLEAWEYAFNNQEEAIKLVKNEMEKKYVAFNNAHQTWMLNRTHDLFKIKEKKYYQGELLRSDFENAYKIFSSLGKIKNDFNYEDFFKGIK